MKLGAATSMALQVVALIGLQLVAAGSVAEMGKCMNVMVALSPCLPYMASAPNNRSSSPSPFCCCPFRASASSRVSGNRSETCLCYLLRNPSLFGFPVDAERIASLVAICHLKSRKTPDAYLRSLCRGSPTAPTPQSHNGSASLPPVGSPTGSPTSPPPNHNGSFTFPPMGSPTGSSPPQNHNGSVTLPPVGSPTGFRTSPPPQKHNGSSTSPPMRSPPVSPTLHPPQRHRGSKTAPPLRSSSIVPSKSSSRPTTTTVRNSSCQFSPGLFTMLFLVSSITLVITILSQHSH